jgi:hypothetical protein
MALATDTDVVTALGRALTTEEQARTPGLLDEAEDVIRGHLGVCARLDPVPDTVRRVAARMVARVLNSPTGEAGLESDQMTAGPFQWSTRYSSDSRSGGPWLSSSDRTALRRFKAGVISVATW